MAAGLDAGDSGEPQEVGEALSTMDGSAGFGAMAPGGKGKFGAGGKNGYGRRVGVQWQNADLASIFPKEDARAPLMKT